MRDPERIHRMCEKFEQLWQECPDWRFAQVVENFCMDSRGMFFYQEDNVTEQLLDYYLARKENDNE